MDAVLPGPFRVIYDTDPLSTCLLHAESDCRADVLSSALCGDIRTAASLERLAGVNLLERRSSNVY
jgi:hypothetical protein